MNDVTRSPQDEPIDLATIQADELLLEALGRGDSVSDGEIGALLTTWRLELAAEIPLASEDLSVTSATGRTARRRVWPRTLRARIAVAAAVVGVLAGGTAVAATNATPGSPLWAISQVINPARAHRLNAENALARARQAIAAKRPDVAASELEKAAKLIAQVNDPQQAAQLRAELAQLSQLLQQLTATMGVPLPGSGRGAPPSSTPDGAGHPSPAPGASGGSGSGPPRVLPTSPLPGVSSLLPTDPLHSLLPSVLPNLPLSGLGG
jgi:hypothetical protein